MRCRDCGDRIGAFDPIVPVMQTRLEGEGVEPSGYIHLWHLTNPEPTP